MYRIFRWAIRVAVSCFQSGRQRLWKLPTSRIEGVHAIAFTTAGNVVLVRLTYAPGWRVPGGAKKPYEGDEAAMLRELREETGMIAHGLIEPRPLFEDNNGRSFGNVFVVHDVQYHAPRWSLEVEEVGAFALDALPEETTPVTRKILAMLDAN